MPGDLPDPVASVQPFALRKAPRSAQNAIRHWSTDTVPPRVGIRGTDLPRGENVASTWAPTPPGTRLPARSMHHAPFSTWLQQTDALEPSPYREVCVFAAQTSWLFILANRLTVDEVRRMNQAKGFNLDDASEFHKNVGRVDLVCPTSTAASGRRRCTGDYILQRAHRTGGEVFVADLEIPRQSAVLALRHTKKRNCDAQGRTDPTCEERLANVNTDCASPEAIWSLRRSTQVARGQAQTSSCGLLLSKPLVTQPY